MTRRVLQPERRAPAGTRALVESNERCPDRIGHRSALASGSGTSHGTFIVDAKTYPLACSRPSPSLRLLRDLPARALNEGVGRDIELLKIAWLEPRADVVDRWEVVSIYPVDAGIVPREPLVLLLSMDPTHQFNAKPEVIRVCDRLRCIALVSLLQARACRRCSCTPTVQRDQGRHREGAFRQFAPRPALGTSGLDFLGHDIPQLVSPNSRSSDDSL